MTIMEADHAEDIRELNDNQAGHSRILKNMSEHSDKRVTRSKSHFDERFDTLERRFDTLDSRIDSVLMPTIVSGLIPLRQASPARSTTPAICPSFPRSSRWCRTYCATTSAKPK